MPNKIFISHSHHDSETCEDIVKELKNAGIREDSIFCTAIPDCGISENDFEKQILRNLNQSVYNIIILSQNYASSQFCQNEAGAIWYFHNCEKKVPMICLAVNKFRFKAMKGFINQHTCHFFRLSESEKAHSIRVLCRDAREAMGLS